VQAVTDDAAEHALVDQDHTVEQEAAAAAKHAIFLEIITLPQAKEHQRTRALPSVARLGYRVPTRS